MRKKEYIHVHALFVEVTEYLIEYEDVPAETLSTYVALDTRPSSIHKSKQAHDEAIRTLGSTLESWLDHTRTDRQQTVDKRQ